MAVKIDYLVQDSEALLQVVNANRDAMNAKGFTEASYNSFVEAKENLQVKELAQQKSIRFVSDMTAEQNAVINHVTDLIKMIRNAARSAYGNDERNLKLFKVGEAVPISVKKLRPMCEYTISLVLEKSEMLLQNGLTQNDTDDLNTSYGKLVAVDANQENAKKLQKAATQARNEAADKLKDKMFRIRNFAKVCFANNKEVLLQFKPIVHGTGGKNSVSTEEVPAEQLQEQRL